MLTAKQAVDNIISGITCKDNIWNINVDDDYHEEKITSKKEISTEQKHVPVAV
jgi:hypothetical protein